MLYLLPPPPNRARNDRKSEAEERGTARLRNVDAADAEVVKLARAGRGGIGSVVKSDFCRLACQVGAGEGIALSVGSAVAAGQQCEGITGAGEFKIMIIRKVIVSLGTGHQIPPGIEGGSVIVVVQRNEVFFVVATCQAWCHASHEAPHGKICVRCAHDLHFRVEIPSDVQVEKRSVVMSEVVANIGNAAQSQLPGVRGVGICRGGAARIEHAAPDRATDIAASVIVGGAEIVS